MTTILLLFLMSITALSIRTSYFVPRTFALVLS